MAQRHVALGTLVAVHYCIESRFRCAYRVLCVTDGNVKRRTNGNERVHSHSPPSRSRNRLSSAVACRLVGTLVWEVNGGSPPRSIWTTGATRSGQTPSNGYPVTTRSPTGGRPNFPLGRQHDLGCAKWAKVILLLLPSSPSHCTGATATGGSCFPPMAHTHPLHPSRYSPPPKPTHKRRFRGSRESGARGARRSSTRLVVTRSAHNIGIIHLLQ